LNDAKCYLYGVGTQPAALLVNQTLDQCRMGNSESTEIQRYKPTADLNCASIHYYDNGEFDDRFVDYGWKAREWCGHKLKAK
jgi:hypothetical protein